MGMTIDEIIEELEESKDYPASDPASEEALNGAIDIIHKYQKIEQIVSLNDEEFKQCGLRELKEILEVIAGWG